MPKGIFKRKVAGKFIACYWCGSKKYYKPSDANNKHFFCSTNHRILYCREHGSWNKGIKGYKQPNISIALKGKYIGEKSGRWRGDEITYHTIHEWIYRRLGKPEECVYCGKHKKEGMIEWASISHKAKRDLNDFISLCVKCHKKYDSHGDKIRMAWKRGAYASR